MLESLLHALVTVVGPLFLAALAGFLATRALRPGPRTSGALRRIAFDVLMPLLLLHAMARVQLPEALPLTLWTVFYVPALGLHFVLARSGIRRGLPAAVANQQGFAATYGNAVLLGIPLALRMLDAQGTVAFALLVAIHAAVLMAAVELIGAMQGAGVRGPALATAARSITRNPIVLSLLAGLALSMRNETAPVRGLIQVLAPVAALAPWFALGVMGMQLAGVRAGSHGDGVARVTVCKLLALPLLVGMPAWALASAGWLAPADARAAILLAAMPTGINAALMAARHGAWERASTTTVLTTTVASLATLTLLAVWLPELLPDGMPDRMPEVAQQPGR